MRRTAPNGSVTLGFTEAFLSDLQGNILRAHGRMHAFHLLLSFGSAPRVLPRCKAWLRRLAADRITTAWRQDAGSSRQNFQFCSLALTHHAYQVLGMPAPASAAFREGMARRALLLNDPPVDQWEGPYRDAAIDGLLIMADDDPQRLAREHLAVRMQAAEASVTILTDEPGRRLVRDGRMIEHFGYVDGIPHRTSRYGSAAERVRAGAIENPEIILIEEPGSTNHWGSYLVFRKLEQNVLEWEKTIDSLAAKLKFAPEVVGALAVGRFKDGTPIAKYPEMQHTVEPDNDFSYADDPMGRRCPHHAHIRKAHSRTAGSADRHAIVRRGMTYGVRPDLHESRHFLPPPQRGVGLLFMCYQADIESQFEYIQLTANDPDRPVSGAGWDPVIGQPHKEDLESPHHKWPNPECSGERQQYPFQTAVTLLGGEYFFVPSMTFLRRL